MNFTSRIYLRKDAPRKSKKESIKKYPIYIDIRYPGVRERFTTYEAVQLKDWNESKSRVNASDVNAARINKKLRSMEKNIEALEDNYYKGKYPDPSRIKEIIFGQQFGESFTEYFGRKVEYKKARVAEATRRSYSSIYKKFKEFRKDVRFGELSVSLLQDFELYLINVKGNGPSTAAKNMKVLRIFITMAVDEDRIEKNPFDKYGISEIDSEREPLSLEDLSALEKLYWEKTLPEGRQNVLRYFLFSCYCGLRYSDIIRLKGSNIITNGALRYIEIVPQKTMAKKKKSVMIPLTEKAASLIPEVQSNRMVFEVYVNQTTNKYLKDIRREAKVQKNLTFHVARHTFATLAGKKGIPIEVIQSWLNHTNISETMKYRQVNHEETMQYLKVLNEP